jgi:23S rRNA (pseudouridine1915-N3)-methyltransferase
MSSTRIIVTAVGKLKERFWVEACAEYQKRLSRYAQVLIEELSDRGNWNADDPQQALLHEGQQIVSRCKTDELIVVLDREGQQFTSEQIAQLIAGQQLAGQARMRFIIGGSHGVSAEILKSADLVISLGSITLPHNLARVVVLEQLYRAFRILADEPYHK